MQCILNDIEERTACILLSVSNPALENHKILCKYHEQHKHSIDGHRPWYVKPATPNNFLGDHTNVHAFINFCELYMALAPHQFVDDNAKIMWVFSFMKTDQAAHFIA